MSYNQSEKDFLDPLQSVLESNLFSIEFNKWILIQIQMEYFLIKNFLKIIADVTCKSPSTFYHFASGRLYCLDGNSRRNFSRTERLLCHEIKGMPIVDPKEILLFIYLRILL